ncbi:MAG: cupin domain-containing protein [Pseudomonadota bacterium]
MKSRRIVTGHDADGKSEIVSDQAAPRTSAFEHVPGFVASMLWSAEAHPVVPNHAGDPTAAAVSWLPPAGGSKLLLITFPPDAVMHGPAFDPLAAGREYLSTIPGLAEKFESEHPGMHTTDTLDYGVLLEGELWLELDGGRETLLHRHDVVVQQGTRHAWRNKSTQPATMLFVLIGAQRCVPQGHL